jgi:RNA polymerase sigma factor (sigma-70 family)
MLNKEEDVIEENKGMAIDLVNRFYNKSPMYDFEDLLQVALMSMVKAHRAYETDKSLFSTFATVCMRNDLIKFINKNKKPKNKEIPLSDPMKNHLLSETEDDSDEYVPDSLTPQEMAIFYYKKRGYKDIEVRDILGVSRKEYKQIVISCFKKVIDSNA